MIYNFKFFLYNIVKYPLTLVIIKTPLRNFLERRFYTHRFNHVKNPIMRLLDKVYQNEYFKKLEPFKLREVAEKTISDSEGVKWAEHYYDQSFDTIEELKSRRFSEELSYDQGTLIFSKTIDFLKKKNLSTNIANLNFIQIGSSSGRNILFFKKIFPEINYISTDINKAILDYQKNKYSKYAFKYYKCRAEDVLDAIEFYEIKKEKIVLFSLGSLQYVNPYFLQIFFLKLKSLANFDLFICEPISMSSLKDKRNKSTYRQDITFSHNYSLYFSKDDFEIIEKKIISIQSMKNKKHRDSGNYFLHIRSK